MPTPKEIAKGRKEALKWIRSLTRHVRRRRWIIGISITTVIVLIGLLLFKVL